MGNMVRHLGNNTTSITSGHQPSDLWKSPRGTVLRIQALAVVAIIITFFLIVFGSCRRWSNRWIVQKGFFAAQVLSLSLGTYCIGIMQSSSVKSEMYPIWTVCLFTIFGCIDPVTSYNGLDYKGPLSKAVYGICLHCGYVLLMSISAISSIVGNTAIGVLAALTFIKGFHRSLALVQQSRMRNMVEHLDDRYHPGETLALRYDYSTDPASIRYVAQSEFVVDFPAGMGTGDSFVRLSDVNELLREKLEGKGRHGRGKAMFDRLYRGCVRLVRMLGLDYFWEVLWDLLGSDINKRAAVRLDDDVKASIIDFLGKIKSDRSEGDWLSFAQDQRIEEFLPYTYTPQFEPEPDGFRYTRCVMAWCVATWYCELAEQEQQELERKQNASSKKKNASTKAAAGGGEREENHRRVAIALSKYCAYLVVSEPELLPGPLPDTKRAYDHFVEAAREARDKDALLKAMLDRQYWSLLHSGNVVIKDINNHATVGGDPPLLDLMRRSDPWETLADVWVRMLVYAAPYGNAEAHMRQLSQGGEFITHLWALLCHLSIREWKLPGNLHDVTAIDHAQRIFTSFLQEKECVLTEDNHAIVVAFLDSLAVQAPLLSILYITHTTLFFGNAVVFFSCVLGPGDYLKILELFFLQMRQGCYSDELAAAAKLEERVSFYRTTSPEIAKLFHIDPEAKLRSLVLLTKEEDFTLYDGEFKRYAIADFVSTNKLPLVPTLTQKTISSLDGHPIQKLIILLAVANESSKFLPNFKEAAKSFKGKLLFFFLERDSEEGKQAAKSLYIPCTGQETMVLAYTTGDKRQFPLEGEVSLDTIKKFAQDFFEDKLYISGTVPESNDEDVKIVVGNNIDQIVLDESKDVLLMIYHPMYRPDLTMETIKNLANLLCGIDSLVIAKMNGTSNWHPRAKLPHGEFFKILFYPAWRKRFEPIAFEGSWSCGVVEFYEFMKKHAGIPFRPISTLEKVSSQHGATGTEIEEIPPMA